MLHKVADGRSGDRCTVAARCYKFLQKGRSRITARPHAIDFAKSAFCASLPLVHPAASHEVAGPCRRSVFGKITMEFCTDSIFGTRHHVYVCSGLPAVIHTWCGECPVRAHPVNSVFSLRAHAALEMLHARHIRCRRAAEGPVIHANRNASQVPNSQDAGRSRHELCVRQCRLRETQ